ncbi:hypothetical protein B7494_g4743 [Chlorociboria aeruginascens]|nr:hypothetical protein B7494_g4743 [Chlorociboria aeruginascens]
MGKNRYNRRVNGGNNQNNQNNQNNNNNNNNNNQRGNNNQNNNQGGDRGNNRNPPNEKTPSRPCKVCEVFGHWDGDCQKPGFVAGQNITKTRPLNPCRDCGGNHRHGSCLAHGANQGDTDMAPDIALSPMFSCGKCGGRHWEAGCPNTAEGRARLEAVAPSLQQHRWEAGWIKGVGGFRDYQFDPDGDVMMTDWDAAVVHKSPWDGGGRFGSNGNQKQNQRNNYQQQQQQQRKNGKGGNNRGNINKSNNGNRWGNNHGNNSNRVGG